MPSQLSPEEFTTQMDAGRLAGVYLLVGSDRETKIRLTERVAGLLDTGLQAFNLDRIRIAEARPDARSQVWALIDLARTHPMMAPWRLVIVRGIEKLVAALGKPEGKGDDPKELAAFQQWLAEPLPGTVVVSVAEGDLDRRTKAVQSLQRYATTVVCNLPGEGGDAAQWIRSAAASEGVRIEASAVRLLVELAGSDRVRLCREFERACLFAASDGTITEPAVRAVAESPDSGGVWALTNALERGEWAAALRELAIRLDRGDAPVMILGQIGWFVRTKLTPTRVARAVDAVFRTDLALKTSRGDARVLLERLIVELSR